MTHRLVILAATVAAAITLTAAPAAPAAPPPARPAATVAAGANPTITLVPRSHVSTRHAFHGAPNATSLDYYWLTLTSRRSFDVHLYAHCADGSVPNYFQITAANERTLDGPYLDQEIHGASKVTLLEPMAAGTWTFYLFSTCKWGLSVQNRVRYQVQMWRQS